MELMNNSVPTVVILYSSELLPETINKFNEVLFLAEYVPSQLKYINIKDFDIKTEVFNYNSYMCFDDTYKIVSSEFQEKYDLLSFELAAEYYFDKGNNLLLCGFPYSVPDVFNKIEDKKKNWKLIQTYYKHNKQLSNIEKEIDVVSAVITTVPLEVKSELVEQIVTIEKETSIVCDDSLVILNDLSNCLVHLTSIINRVIQSEQIKRVQGDY
jgi:hypothetical protein